MIIKFGMVEPFWNAPKRFDIYLKCRETRILKWDSVGDGRNITLTSLRHEECLKKYWRNIEKFDYKVTIKEEKLKEVA